jgi:hypothetical protein
LSTVSTGYSLPRLSALGAVDKTSGRRILRANSEEATMAVMCSMQACAAKAGMCGHEKMMLGIVVVLVAGVGAYFLLG